MYHPIVTDFLFLLLLIGAAFGIVFTMLYWFIRILVAAVGYEFTRGTKALKKWADS